MFVSTRLLKTANSRSQRSLSFVSALQLVPQTSPKSACTTFPTLTFQSRSERPTILMIVGQGPIALAVGAGGWLFGIFLLSSVFSLLFLPLSGLVGFGLSEPLRQYFSLYRVFFQREGVREDCTYCKRNWPLFRLSSKL